LIIFWKSVKKIEVQLRSDTDHEYFTGRRLYSYDSSFLNYS